MSDRIRTIRRRKGDKKTEETEEQVAPETVQAEAEEKARHHSFSITICPEIQNLPERIA